MALLPKGMKIHLGLDLIDMRKGLDGLAMLVHRLISLHQAAGAECFPVAVECRTRRHDDADVGAAVDADRRDRLAHAGSPLTVSKAAAR
jgi:hypothetical protein